MLWGVFCCEGVLFVLFVEGGGEGERGKKEGLIFYCQLSVNAAAPSPSPVGSLNTPFGVSGVPEEIDYHRRSGARSRVVALG